MGKFYSHHENINKVQVFKALQFDDDENLKISQKMFKQMRFLMIGMQIH